ncbi:MAG: 3-phosphoshikimate 1-carboxyvinyltransferase [Pirellula sp.]|nr:3-phosphoshikimate 1-carboxyvinyltransferase [Pirellula sp.]
MKLEDAIKVPSLVSLSPVSMPVSGTVRVPGSKSLTNRALICAAMAEGASVLSGVLESEDTEVMIHAWQALGLKLNWDRELERVEITGCAGVPGRHEAELFVANSGTSIRFLTAALATMRGRYLLDGVPRMRERPIGDLLSGLAALGANVVSTNAVRNDCPPVKIEGCRLQGGETSVAGNVSSQFLSGLLMAAPYALSNVRIKVVGELVSRPYVDMTVAIMRDFGVLVEEDDCVFTIPAPAVYRGRQYRIEPDASAASYFFGIAAMTRGVIRVEGLDFNSLQGDVHFVKVLEQMGCRIKSEAGYIELTGGPLRGVDVDMNSISDTVQTLAPLALFANGPTRVRGVAHNRHKETDRISDLARELRKFGARIDEHDDGLTIYPVERLSELLNPSREPIYIDTYRDHRMAMGIGMLGVMVPNVFIRDPRCTSKTFPKYFETVAELVGQKPSYSY